MPAHSFDGPDRRRSTGLSGLLDFQSVGRAAVFTMANGALILYAPQKDGVGGKGLVASNIHAVTKESAKR
jgi:hypothetical protein